jgi:hypothetical protein
MGVRILSEEAHIFDVAWRTGGQAILAATGNDADTSRGSDLLRESITRFAQDGGATFIDQTITSLFGNAPSLTDAQVSQLGAALVEQWQP